MPFSLIFYYHPSRCSGSRPFDYIFAALRCAQHHWHLISFIAALRCAQHHWHLISFIAALRCAQHHWHLISFIAALRFRSAPLTFNILLPLVGIEPTSLLGTTF
jgi:hypothetical protein